VTRRPPGVAVGRLAARFRRGTPRRSGRCPGGVPCPRPGATGILWHALADRVDAELMDAAGPSLPVVSNFAVGVNNVDVAGRPGAGSGSAIRRSVLTDATADLGFALLLSAAEKSVGRRRGSFGAGRWTGWDPWGFLGVPVAGKTLGIGRVGKIGAGGPPVPRFAMKILLLPQPSPDSSVEEAGLGASYRDLDALLAESDFVVLCVPLTPGDTHRMPQ